MENASKALIIAGAILLSILIIAIGIYIFNGANSTVVNSMQSMTTSEIEAFNNQFIQYDGKQSGSNLKSLVGRLIANANTYKDERQKTPTLGAVSEKWNAAATPGIKNAYNNEDIDIYIGHLGNIRNAIENKHMYTVTFLYDTSGLIYSIQVKYDEE